MNTAQPNLTSMIGLGQIVDPLTITRRDLTVEVMADGLSRLNRYAGNGSFTLSVAQHCVELSKVVPAHLVRAALLHDVPEIFIGEIPIKVKRLSPEINDLEDKILRRVAKIFKVNYHEFLELTPWDHRIAGDEMAILFPQLPESIPLPRRLGITIIPKSAEVSRNEWIDTFRSHFEA